MDIAAFPRNLQGRADIRRHCNHCLYMRCDTRGARPILAFRTPKPRQGRGRVGPQWRRIGRRFGHSCDAALRGLLAVGKNTYGTLRGSLHRQFVGAMDRGDPGNRRLFNASDASLASSPRGADIADVEARFHFKRITVAGAPYIGRRGVLRDGRRRVPIGASSGETPNSRVEAIMRVGLAITALFLVILATTPFVVFGVKNTPWIPLVLAALAFGISRAFPPKARSREHETQTKH
jgi:hypothetical protein